MAGVAASDSARGEYQKWYAKEGPRIERERRAAERRRERYYRQKPERLKAVSEE